MNKLIFSRWKQFLVEAAIFILLAISLLDFVWTKLSPYVTKAMDMLR